MKKKKKLKQNHGKLSMRKKFKDNKHSRDLHSVQYRTISYRKDNKHSKALSLHKMHGVKARARTQQT